jgi:predicted transposase YdaD
MSADIIYKLYFKDRQLYLYLLIEFQSTVDRFISFRMLNYVMELYRELIYKQKLKKLPVVFLYLSIMVTENGRPHSHYRNLLICRKV